MSYFNLETALLNHPDVVEVCAISVPVPGTEKSVKAFVALRKGSTTDNAVLQAFLKEQVNGISESVDVQVLPELPKGPTGAVSRRLLAALC